MSHVKTDKLSARTASGTITLGESGETLTVPSGVTLAVASGATISNAGTASGFGGLILLSSLTNSSSVSELEFSLPDLNDYRAYYFYFTNLTGESAGYLRMQLSTDGGSTYITSGYSPQSTNYIDVHRNDISSVANCVFQNFGIYIFARNDNSVAYSTGVSFQSGSFKRSASPQIIQAQLYFNTIVNSTTSSINAFKLFMSTGNMSGGTFKLYGITN